ncbi:hypothetical protein IAD21_02225 [Abditibacteriota bacterium]|nr:hypothetical protein IAD21_02225 [Abditibacteriota bacterium]
MLKTSCSSRRRVASVTALVGVCCLSLPLWAQEKADLPTAQAQLSPFGDPVGQFQPVKSADTTSAPQLYRGLIHIRNVKASVVAYWLDSAQHPVPLDMQLSQQLADEGRVLATLPRLPGNGNGPLDLKLPAGVTSLVPIDPQNALLATGTQEGLQALTALIPTIDVPLVQYEIEAQFLQISRADLAATGLKFANPPKQAPDYFGSVAMVPASFHSKDLLDRKRARILTDPRVTVIDGLTGWLRMTTSTPFVLDDDLMRQHMSISSDAKPGGKGVEQARDIAPGGDIAPGVALLTNTTGMRVTALHRKDDLVLLSINPVLGTRSISVATTVREDQSFAIQMSPAKDARQIIVVVTLRRIRRLTE